jgi:ankyrin repeat protein
MAVRFHRHELFDWMVQTADVNDTDIDGKTALHAACESNNLYALRRLLDAGADPNIPSVKGATPVITAACRGSFDAIRVLLATPGVDPHHLTLTGDNAVHCAALRGDLDICQALVEAGVDPDLESGFRRSPLMLAIISRRASVVRYLINLPDVDPNRAHKNGATPLDHALVFGTDDIFNMMLRHPRIDRYHLFQGLPSVMYAAIKANRYDIFMRLLDDPALPLVSRSGYSFLHVAVKFSRTAMVSELLKHRELDINSPSADGSTALHSACRYGPVEIIRQLLADPRIDINKAALRGQVPMHAAMAFGNIDAIRCLIGHPLLDVNDLGAFGKSLLHSAITLGLPAVVEMLCDRKDLDVNAKTRSSEGCLPIVMAVSMGNAEVVEILMKRKDLLLRVNISGGRTLRDIALSRGNQRIVKLIDDDPRSKTGGFFDWLRSLV